MSRKQAGNFPIKRLSEPKLRDEVRRTALELTLLETRLHTAGLIRTAHAINKAKQELGWEAAEQFEERSKS
jgi:hypothetical protein